MPALTTSIQHCARDSSQFSEGTQDKRHKDEKERCNTVSLYRWLDCLYKNSKKYRKQLKWIASLAGSQDKELLYKNWFLHTSSKQLENEL